MDFNFRKVHFPSLFTEHILLPIFKPPIILGFVILLKTLKVNGDDRNQEEEADGLNYLGLKFKTNCQEPFVQWRAKCLLWPCTNTMLYLGLQWA